MKSVFNFAGFNTKSPYNIYPIQLGDKMYNIEVGWNSKFEFPYFLLYDEYNNLLIATTALVNNLQIKIDQRELKGSLQLIHKDGELYEPDLDTIEEEFLLVYDDGQ